MKKIIVLFASFTFLSLPAMVSVSQGTAFDPVDFAQKGLKLTAKHSAISNKKTDIIAPELVIRGDAGRTNRAILSSAEPKKRICKEPRPLEQGSGTVIVCEEI